MSGSWQRTVRVRALTLLGTLALLTLGCEPHAGPGWTPGTAAAYAVIWTYEGKNAGGSYFNDGPAPKLRRGVAYARVSCSREAVLEVGVAKVGRPGPVVPPPPRLTARLNCTPHSAARMVQLAGDAQGGEDVLLVTAHAGATGREDVSYRLEILQAARTPSR